MDTYSDRNIARIREAAQRLRTKHRAMEWGVTPVFLMKKEGLDYDEYDLSDEGGILMEFCHRVTKLIKAAIIFTQHVILIDTELHDSKKPFGQGHELGHHTLEDHRAIFRVCSEHDLNPKTREAMEFEANQFSSEILLPTPLLSIVHKDYPVSMETILLLNDWSGASIHACAIKYVKSSPHECCLLTLEIEQDDETGSRGLRMKDQILSGPWFARHGKTLKDRQFFDENHAISQVVFSASMDEIVKTRGNVKNRNIAFETQAFYNGYTVFALLIPDP